MEEQKGSPQNQITSQEKEQRQIEYKRKIENYINSSYIPNFRRYKLQVRLNSL